MSGAAAATRSLTKIRSYLLRPTNAAKSSICPWCGLWKNASARGGSRKKIGYNEKHTEQEILPKTFWLTAIFLHLPVRVRAFLTQAAPRTNAALAAFVGRNKYLRIFVSFRVAAAALGSAGLHS